MAGILKWFVISLSSGPLSDLSTMTMKDNKHLNEEFQRIERRDKKAFLSNQCKETEEKIEWERLGNISCKDGLNKEQKWYGPNIPGSYAILLFRASDLTYITSHIHNWVFLLLWFHVFILFKVISPLLLTWGVHVWLPGAGEAVRRYPTSKDKGEARTRL